jgi:ATP-binding cassette, subfamily B, bacterial
VTGSLEPERLTLRGSVRHGQVAFGAALCAAPGSVVGLVLFAVAAGLVPVASAWLLKLILDSLLRNRAPADLVALVVVLAIVGMAAAALPQLIRYSEATLSRSARLLAFDRLFDSVNARLRGLARLERPQFHDQLRLAQDAGAAAPASVVTGFLDMSKQALTLVGFLATLLALNPFLAAAVALAGVPTVRAELRLARQRAAMLSRIVTATRRQHFYANLLSAPHDAKEVRLFGAGGFLRNRMLRELRRTNETEQRLGRRELVVQSLLGVLAAVLAGGGLAWAVYAARAGQLTVGDVSLFVVTIAGVQLALSTVLDRFGALHEALLMLGHYQAVVSMEPDLPVPAKPSPIARLRRGIAVRQVWFRYGTDRPWVLRGVDLTIPAGGSVALVGLNGAGKSTLVKLLCRLYDPTRGGITWDGTDLRDFDPAELRARMSAVFQDFAQYELSAAENIGLGRLAALDRPAALVAAASHAGIHETLAALPAGYDTPLTRTFLDQSDRADPDTGVLLSGGQWQRVALARALVRDDVDLLILDEPSAGLDAEAEAEIHSRLRERPGRCARLLISHRLNTVRDADAIVVIADGQVVEQGDHATLVAAGGRYARLFSLQARGYVDAVGSVP